MCQCLDVCVHTLIKGIYCKAKVGGDGFKNGEMAGGKRKLNFSSKDAPLLQAASPQLLVLQQVLRPAPEL